MTFDATYKGRVYQLRNGVVYALRADGKFAAAYANEGRLVRVALTGYSAVSPKGNTHYQTTSGGWIYIPDGWELIGTQSISQYSQAQAQAQVDKIIKNNILIVQNNLVCARFVHKFTADQQAQIAALQRRAEERKEALQAQGLCKNVQTSYPKGYADLADYLDALMRSEAIGIATWAVVVIVASVIAATATTAYLFYKSIADESEKDVKFSKELTAVLAQKLTPEEYQQLLNETKGIVTKARIKQAAGSYWNVLQIGAFAIAGYFVYNFIKDRLK